MALYNMIFQAKEFDDPPGFFEKVESYMREWLQIYHSPTASRDNCKGFTTFLMQVSLNVSCE